jgi:hypothetical protein
VKGRVAVEDPEAAAGTVRIRPADRARGVMPTALNPVRLDAEGAIERQGGRKPVGGIWSVSLAVAGSAQPVEVPRLPSKSPLTGRGRGALRNMWWISAPVSVQRLLAWHCTLWCCSLKSLSRAESVMPAG